METLATFEPNKSPNNWHYKLRLQRLFPATSYHFTSNQQPAAYQAPINWLNSYKIRSLHSLSFNNMAPNF